MSRGLGDLTLGVTRNFAAPPDQPWSWSAGAEVKFATASTDRSLGTGEDDYATHVDLSYAAGRLTPFATLGYRWLGNPAGSDLRNYLFGTVGVNLAYTDQTTLALMMDWAEKNSTSGKASANFTVSVTRAFGDQWQVQAYGVLGQSDATADYGLGLSLSRGF